jgi:hypothetical protein
MSAQLKLKLAQLNRLRFAPPRPDTRWQVSLDEEAELHRLEVAWIENKRAQVVHTVRAVPRDPTAFVAWFEALKLDGPGQGDPLFPWLAEHATLDQLTWFLRQELAANAMGLSRLAAELDLASLCDEVVWEATAVGSLLAGLAANRRYAYQSIGARGVVELTAPTRAELVRAGLARLGIARHATPDVKESETWNRDVLARLVSHDPSLAPLIAEGALLRLEAGAACFARYRSELRVDDARAA